MAAGDTALWLHNKLGSTDDLWSGKIICSQLTRERLINIQDCFHALQSHVKVKLLLSFLHIPKRNIEQWQQDLEEIILLGINDTDPWVATIGEIMREFPSSGALLLVEQDTNATDSNMAFCLEEIKHLVKNCNMSMIPLECQYLNKASLSAVAGQIPEPSKHFTIKRRPKSAALRAEIIQKSSDTVLNKRNHTASSVPIKSRSFAKRMDTNNSNFTPLKMTPGRSPYPNTDFRSPGTPLNRTPLSGRSPITPLSIASRSSSKKDSKIKLLEIEEMPVGAKEAKRRKKIADMEALEAQKKEKEALAAAAASNQQTGTPSTTSTTVTPDYAAGLIPSAPPKLPMTVLSVSNPALPQPSPAYLPSSARQTAPNVTITSNLASSLQATTATNLSEQLKQQLLQSQTRTATITASPLPNLTPILISQQQPSSINNPQQQLQSISSIRATLPPSSTPIVPSSPLTTTPAAPRPVLVQQSIRPTVQQPQVLTVRPVQPQQSTSQPTQSQQVPSSGVKTGLSLTKDQMLEAQEMFRVSNKVSRPEKALILGFMAGSRENPCAQRGNILNIKLSEKEEVVLMPDGTKKKKIEDTIFQMNYATGEWKRFLNIREADVS